MKSNSKLSKKSFLAHWQEHVLLGNFQFPQGWQPKCDSPAPIGNDIIHSDNGLACAAFSRRRVRLRLIRPLKFLVAGAAVLWAAINLVSASPPSIVLQPVGKEVPTGSSCMLTVYATSSSEFSGFNDVNYHWQFDKSDISGETSSNLVINHISAGQAGKYRVVASNRDGRVLSDEVQLSLLPALSPWNFNLLYIFTGKNDGGTPLASLIIGGDGNFMGTTSTGGSEGFGTVYSIKSSGDLEVIYSFKGRDDGGQPQSKLLLAKDGNYYGTTIMGGAQGAGTIYRLAPNGSFTTLHSFTGGNDGGQPYAGLLEAPDGSLYGSTYQGGQSSAGTIYRIHPDGIFETLYSFAPFSNIGQHPASDLMLAKDGFIYGATSHAIFRMAPNAPLTLMGPADSYYVFDFDAGPVEGEDGRLYGTATQDDGLIYRMNQNGSIDLLFKFSWFTVVHAVDGFNPVAPLTLGRDGNFYGTTAGSSAIRSKFDTIFQITTNGILTTLHTFDTTDWLLQNHDGAGPASALLEGLDGGLYGVMQAGGSNGQGTVFVLRPPNSPPVISSSPASQQGSVGGSISFSVAATGVGPIFFQWQFNGSDIAGATNATLTLQNLILSQAGTYAVVVSNGNGRVTSDGALLSFPAVPEIHLFPVLTIPGQIGNHYRIDVTSDMQNTNVWTPLTNITLTTSPFYFIDMTTPQIIRRFYRAMPMP